MTTAPFQQIPDSTQVHVDRLVGTQVGEFEVGARVVEGRFGTIYRARQRASGKDLTLEVLRTEITGDDEEARAANAIKCAGIADVIAFGHVPDGRRYRVMELLDGESLDQVLQRGRLAPAEVALRLGQVAAVLEAAHAWALPHGSLGPSSVFLAGSGVKLIDFGLVKRRASIEGDLQALGALGFTLLLGEDLADRGAPPLGSGIPEPLDRVLRELLEKRVKDATAARKALAALGSSEPLRSVADDSVLSERSRGPVLVRNRTVTRPLDSARGERGGSTSSRGSRVGVLAVLALVVAGAGAAAFLVTSRPPQVAPPPVETPVPLEDEGLLLDEATDLEPEEARTLQTDPAQPEPVQTRPAITPGPRRARPLPTATALMEETSRLEARFRQQARPGDDIDQALYVLNKQRLRLSGSPTEQDRKDVARQLAGWRRSYLRR